MNSVLNVVVIGATGDVGRGIVGALLDRGHRVSAVARDPSRLDSLRAARRDDSLVTIAGSIGSDESAAQLLDDVRARPGAIDGVVVSVNAPRRWGDRLLAHTSDSFASLLRQDVVSHFTAARTFIPAIRAGGTYLGIGGGTADFVLPDGAYMSVGQAGLRMMYRALAEELTHPIELRELIIASVVNGESTRATADPHWVTAEEIGRHAAAILENPRAFPAALLRLSRRGQAEPVPDPELQKRRGA